MDIFAEKAMPDFVAEHVNGLGKASANLPFQLPVIEKDFPEIRGVRNGTINLKLPFPIIFAGVDYRTPPLEWDRNRKGHREAFDLVRCSVEAPIGNSPQPAWFYIPHGSKHRENLLTQELIAGPLSTKPGDKLRIGINRAWIHTPPYAPFFNGRIVL